MGKKKILLVQPPLHPDSIIFGFMEPYALEVLATTLMENSLFKDRVEVEILDLRVNPFEALSKRLRENQIEIVGVTGITIDAPMMLRVASAVKHLSPSTLVVVGGHHATMMPGDFFHQDIDLVVRGHGHNVFPLIVERRFLGNHEYAINGVAENLNGKFEEHGSWIENITGPPPVPNRHLVPRRYRCFAKPMSVVVTAQGCQSRCNFCACWPAVGGQYLTKSPEAVISEIFDAPEKYIFLGDDNTFGNIERAREIARLLKNLGIRKQYDGYCRADIIAEHPELIEQWSKVGLGWLTVGFEAIDNKELESLHKCSTIETNREANRILQKFGVINYAHILIRPDFGQDEFHRIWRYVHEMGIVEPVFPIQTPLPGTVLWKSYKNELKDMPRQFFDLAHPLTATSLPVNDFYDQLLGLMGKNYAFRRWLRAKILRAGNLMLDNRFSPVDAVAPSLVSIVGSMIWLKKEFRPKKILEFIDCIKKRKE